MSDELGTLLVMRCIERLAIKGPAGSGKKKAWNLSYSINAPMERTILSLPSSSAKQMVFYSWDSVAEKT